MSETPVKLLLVDDDAELARMLVEFLELQGFAVQHVKDGESALAAVGANPPDLMILDVMLPGMNGFEVLEKLRQTRELPVIMLTARGEEADRILGLMGGADDYLPKPFNPLELAVRIRTVLKRALTGAANNNTTTFEVGPLHLDLKKAELLAHDKPVSLTAGEMRVLEQLMRRPGEVISRGKLTELALDRPIEAYDRSIDTLISKLRRKLGDAGVSGECIKALRGHGYVLDEQTIGNP